MNYDTRTRDSVENEPSALGLEKFQEFVKALAKRPGGRMEFWRFSDCKIFIILSAKIAHLIKLANNIVLYKKFGSKFY